MEKILVLKSNDQGTLCNERGLSVIHGLLHPNCSRDCIHVFSKDAIEDIGVIIKEEIRRGVRDILILPLCVNPGMSAPIVKEIVERFPSVKIRSLESGDSLKMIEVVRREALSPEGIEQRSFEMLTAEDPCIRDKFNREEQAIIKRVVHATADFDFVQDMLFHPEAISHGIRMISEGKTILTDIEMVRAGISKKLAGRFGCSVICGLNSNEVPEPGIGQTRTETAVEFMLRQDRNIGMVVVGNAPTALLKAIEVLNQGEFKPFPLVIGVPVGFVKAFESKVILSLQRFPFITNLSRKGGTPVAVAIVNALFRLAEEVC